ncbi:MAG: ABC transporter ATP-binding protein/permease, partial [Alphaproteobacteria bacterium]|nr:ABC transporter ATP-binding protein/permease [Alphaproteobacteria bacterium]
MTPGAEGKRDEAAGVSAPPRPAGTLRDFAGLAGDYWRGDQRWPAWRTTALLAAVSVGQVFLQLRLNIWSHDFFNAVDTRDTAAVARGVVVFLVLAVGLMGAAAWQIDLKMAIQGGWRRALSHRLLNRWLDRGTHYQLRFMGEPTDNPDQRIADDVFLVTQGAVDFSVGIMVSVLLLFGFFGVLWSLSGTLHVAIAGLDVAIPGYLVIAALVYAIVGTAVADFFGRPLTAINEQRHAREGDFRSALLRVEENSESIAFMGGEATERRWLDDALDRLLANWSALKRRMRRLTWVTSGYTIAAPVFPLLIAAPQYLAGDLTLGGLMQASWAFVQIQAALGWFVDNYARIADWHAGVNRILALDDAVGVIQAPPAGDAEQRIRLTENGDGRLRLVDLQVATHDGTVVIDRASAEIAPGEKVLIVGESGVGKSTLIRAIAGLWPWGAGRIDRPAGARMMFVPQRAYVPAGTLRAALAYPASPEDIEAPRLSAALERCGLAALVPRLDEEARWDAVLSDADRQRLSFARLLVHRPDWIFLDETTSTFDDQELAAMMGLFKTELAGATLVTVEHRPGLEPFHDRTLTLVRLANGARLVVGYRRPVRGGDG